MDNNIVIEAADYNHVNGRNAYQSDIKRFTLGLPVKAENKKMQIAMQVWKEDCNGNLVVDMEIPIHQVFDFMIFLSSTLLHFKEAYRMPLLYNPDKPDINRIGLQGDAMTIRICTKNPDINKRIQEFSQSLNDLGELTGERLRVLTRLIEELKEY